MSRSLDSKEQEALPDWIRFSYLPKHIGEMWEDIVVEDRSYVERVLTMRLPPVLRQYLTRLMENE
jgi:hypothetical protein